MKICFISPYPPKKCGISTYTKEIVDSLVNNNINVTVVPFNCSSDIKYVYSKLKKNNPDIVRIEYALSIYGLLSPLVLAILYIFKIKNKNKTIVNFHEVKKEIDLLGILGIANYFLVSMLFDKIYVHTKEAKEILENKCRINSQKISIIPHSTFNFVDTNYYNKELKAQYKLSNKPIVLYFGFILSDKGIEYLLEAIHHLQIYNPNLVKRIQVIIAGDVRPRSGVFKCFEKKDRQYKNRLKKISKEFQLNETVKFIGFIEEKFVYSLIKLASIAVMPYTKVEQSGVLHRILPLNKPIIASNIGGLQETLKKVGILVKPRNAVAIAEAITLLLKNKNYYKKISNGYKKLSRKLDVSQVNNIFIESLVNP
ncbi:glycosyltransferase [Patescibacteria group bacterium]|nr:glycosyltransferase [Patescibacteria group bacterium]